MKRTRVTILTGSLSFGGSERNILHLATRLDPRRFEVEVFSDYEGEPIQDELRAAGISCRSLKGAPSFGRSFPARLLLHNLPYQWKLYRMLRARRDGIVHAFGFPMIYYAVLHGRLAGCRRVVFAVQDWDVWKCSGVYRLLDRVCSRLAWRIVSDGTGARRLAEHRQGMEGRRMLTIYDGVNMEELRPQRPAAETRRELGLDLERPTAGVIARLDMAKKGQDIFLRALSRIVEAVPQAQFILVGDGPDRRQIERLAETLPPKARPVFAGFRNDLADVLAALDVLVIPSRWESVPKILLEGMWLARPVVATRVGDMGEILDESCGVLVKSDDPDALADALARLLNDKLLREKLGRAGKEKILARGLTLGASVRAYERLYAGNWPTDDE